MSSWKDDLNAWLLDTFSELPSEYKAEIVDGEIHIMSPDGGRVGRARGNVMGSLRAAERTGSGTTLGGRVAFLVDLPTRGSFSPDVAWHTGYTSPSDGMEFPCGAPLFATEIRNAHEYGPRMEAKLARKRDDYFAAGTLVVWDVDLLGPDTIRVYRAGRPDTPDVFRRGETADAEPAVPGWRFPVDELFA